MADNLTISSANILLVEGKDEVKFIRSLLKKLNKLDDVQTIDVGGKDKFRNELPALMTVPGFEEVRKIGIIRDADNSFQGTFQSVCTVISNNHLTPPAQNNAFSNGTPKVGIFVMPGDFENGMLEDLCLKTQQDHPVMECVEAFIQCLATKEIDQPKNVAKAKCQVFLAAMPEIVYSVGIGAEKNYWNLDNPHLETLVGFLNNLSSQ